MCFIYGLKSFKSPIHAKSRNHFTLHSSTIKFGVKVPEPPPFRDFQERLITAQAKLNNKQLPRRNFLSQMLNVFEEIMSERVNTDPVVKTHFRVVMVGSCLA